MLDAQKMGIIDIESVKEKSEMAKRNELLSKHKYAITEGKDGRWVTVVYVEGVNGEPVRKMIRRKTREAVEDALVEFYTEQAENPTIREVFTEWNDLRLECNEISAATHGRNVRCFNRHYQTFGDRKIKALTYMDVVTFLKKQVSEFGLDPKAFSNLKGITIGLLEYAKQKGEISFALHDVEENLVISRRAFGRKIKDDSDEVFSDAETDIIIPYLTENLDAKNLGLLLIFFSGIRVGELATLKREDLTDCTVKIRRTETRYENSEGIHYAVSDFPKTAAGVREIVIPQDYLWILRKIKNLNPFGKPDEFALLNRDGERIKTYSYRDRLRYVCNKLGIKPKSPHKIRKTYGSILLDNGTDNRLILGQMGHASIGVTENHYHRNRRDVEAKLNIISNIPEFKRKQSAIM